MTSLSLDEVPSPYPFVLMVPQYETEGVLQRHLAAHGAAPNLGIELDRLTNVENVIGSTHDDVLIGDGKANRIEGGGGNDVLVGGEGADWLDGGDGIDTADYSGAKSGVIVGLNVNPAQYTEGGVGYAGEAQSDRLFNIENLTGSAYDDLLHGEAGANRLDGGKGNDRLVGSGGADTLIGGEGIDTAVYTDSAARVEIDLANGTGKGGEAEGDTLFGVENLEGSRHDDILLGDEKANRIDGGAGNDTLEGRDGDDVLAGGEGGDWLDGGRGNDTADYSAAKGRVVVGLNVNPLHHADGGMGYDGEAYGDRLFNIENLIGSAYGDLLHGDDNANRLDGGAGDDHLVGAGGDDTLVGGEGADRIEGGSGIDTVDYSRSAAGVTVYLAGNPGIGGDAAGDVISEVENVIGSDHADILSGDIGDNRLDAGKGNDWISGGSGNDVLAGGQGADTLHGNEGIDTVDYSTSNTGVKVQLNVGGGAGKGWYGDAEGDTLTGIENLVGSNYGDTLIGDHQDNVIDGGSGNDVLEGWDGNDTLLGGTGNDTLAGKTGNDRLGRRRWRRHLVG